MSRSRWRSMAARRRSRMPVAAMPRASAARISATTARFRAACSRTAPGSARPAGRCLRATACRRGGLPLSAGVGVPVAPADIGEAAEIRAQRAPLLLLIGRDAFLGLRDLAREPIDRLLPVADPVVTDRE